MITPHGGKLVNLFLAEQEEAECQGRLGPLVKKCLDEAEAADLELLANGGYSPLTGFMGEQDYYSVLRASRLTSGLVWTIPVVLSIFEEELSNYKVGKEVALVAKDGGLLGQVEVAEVYQRNKELEAESVYGTSDRNHPGVRYLYSQGDYLLGGRVKAVKNSGITGFPKYELRPEATRREFEKRGWETIVAFQTRNPIHRAHEYLQKVALEMVDGLFIHPLVGSTKPGDIPAEVRMQCYEAIIKDYYPEKRVMLGVFPAAMRYAGPKEAVFHAIVRKNYGCTHFIVGRDHAGVGNYYGTYDAQNLFDQFKTEEIGINILKFENTFYCKKCDNLASNKTCPHGEQERVFLSGTKVRELLNMGADLPIEFTRPEIAGILKEYYQSMLAAVD